MARRRIIEGTWACTSCDERGIPGRHAVCPSCGNPRENREASFTFDAAAPTVAPELVERARAGVDRHCPRCAAANRGDASVCVQCGAPLASEAPPPPPRPSRSVAPPVRRGGCGCGVGLGAAGLVAATIAAGFALVCGGVVWSARPREVAAVVAERRWTREVRVERLTMRPSEAWREDLPPLARVPGSGALSPGRGRTLGCDTRACWPRPPAGATFGRVTGRSWVHAVSTRTLVEASAQGWDDEVPAATGELPSGGRGGREGRVGPPRCASKERVAERCRTETRREACGSHEVCERRDLGNGFAEEVCDDVTDWCNRSERVCEPAVRDDWCSWRTLAWAPGRSLSERGTDGAPRWPAVSLGATEVAERTATYTVTIEPLAGPRLTEVHPSTADGLLDPGAWVFARAASLDRAPAPPDTRRVDCGDGIPQGVLATRDWCTYERWDWRPEPPRVATGADAAPAWPDPALGEDGRAAQVERVELVLRWTRGDAAGERTVEIAPAAWDQWPIGRTVPVKVDRSAQFLAFPGGAPQ